MEIIRYSSEDLRNRANQLRQLESRYDFIQSELNYVMNELTQVYLIEEKAVVQEELNLTPSIQDIAIKLDKLANILEERADQIENESKDTNR